MTLQEKIEAKKNNKKVVEKLPLEDIEIEKEKESETLEEIIEDELSKLTEEDQKLLAYKENDKILDEDIPNIDEIEQMLKDSEKEMTKDNKCKGYILLKEDIYEIKKFLLNIKDLQIESKNTLYKNLIEILKETHYIKKSQSANNKTTYGLMFAAGVAFGMSDSKWMPFAKGIYEFFTTILK